jgi:hypothetical protein
MATEAPRVVAQYVSSSLTTPPHTGSEQDLRALFILEDADQLWNEIYAFVQTKPHPTGDTATITQDLFLHLLATQKTGQFLQENFSLEASWNERLAQLCEHPLGD